MIEIHQAESFIKDYINSGEHIKDVNYKAGLEQTVGMVAKEVFDYLFESFDALTQSDQTSIRSGLHDINGERIISMNGASLPTSSDPNEKVLNYFRSMSQVPPKLDRSRLNYLPEDDDTVVFSQISGTVSVRSSVNGVRRQIPMPVQPQTIVEEPKFNYNFVPSKDASYNWDFNPNLYGRKIYL